MSDTEPRIDAETVRHVAGLARLRLDDAQVEAMRVELDAVLESMATLAALDVTGIEPMAHPHDVGNRLDPDETRAALPIEAILRNAPLAEDRYLAVPKVIEVPGASAS